jgi:hypothetical protein
LEPSYWFDHFIEEGRVLYLVGEDKCVINRESLYKIKPKDIELYHWEQFDSQVQCKVLLAVRSLFEKEKVFQLLSIFQVFRNLLKRM